MTQESNKTSLCVLCSKDPDESLCVTILGIKSVYPEFDILIIDSDSEKTEMYDRIGKDFPEIKIHLGENKNYEIGAWKMAYDLYPEYDIYMCLQDNVLPLIRLPNIEKLNVNDVYILPHDSGLEGITRSNPKPPGPRSRRNKRMLLRVITELISKTKYYTTFLKLKEERFSITSGNNFITSNYIMRKLTQNLDRLPCNKEGSCSYERILSFFFIEENCNILRASWKGKIKRQTGLNTTTSSLDPIYFLKTYRGRP